jgi:hypothetical protein
MAVVLVHSTSESVVYLSRLIQLGAMVGAPSNVSINPTIQPLVDALYEVLAGGSVTGTAPGVLTITPGVPTVVADLRRMQADSIASVNTTNSAVGYSHVMTS